MDHCSMLESRKHKAVPFLGHDDVRKRPESCSRARAAEILLAELLWKSSDTG